MKRLARISMILFLYIGLTACFSWGGGEEEELAPDGQPHLYIIDVDRGAVAESFAKDRVLLLKPVRVVPHFKSKQLVFRVGEDEYQPQQGQQFFAEPSEMFTDQLRRWLLKSGLFSQVIVDDSAKADYVLESAVTALYGEQRNAYSPESVVEMQFFMSSAEDDAKTMLFQTGFRVDVDIERTTPGNVVSGWKNGMAELLTNLEQDLSGYFSKLDTQ